jgi:hypothetical protein
MPNSKLQVVLPHCFVECFCSIPDKVFANASLTPPHPDRSSAIGKGKERSNIAPRRWAGGQAGGEVQQEGADDIFAVCPALPCPALP